MKVLVCSSRVPTLQFVSEFVVVEVEIEAGNLSAVAMAVENYAKTQRKSMAAEMAGENCEMVVTAEAETMEGNSSVAVVCVETMAVVEVVMKAVATAGKY